MTSDFYFLFATCIALVLPRLLLHVLPVPVEKTLYCSLRYFTIDPSSLQSPSLLHSTHTNFTSSPTPPLLISTPPIHLFHPHSSHYSSSSHVSPITSNHPRSTLPSPMFRPWPSSHRPAIFPDQAFYLSSPPVISPSP